MKDSLAKAIQIAINKSKIEEDIIKIKSRRAGA